MSKNESIASAGRCPFAHSSGAPESEKAGARDMSALVESEAKYAGIIDSAMDAIITIDDAQKIVLFNKAAEKMFRCSRENAMGQPLDIFIPQRFRDVHRHHVENFDHSQVADRAMGRQKTLAALRVDGEEFPIEASISQAVVNGRKHFTAIIRDISERIRVQRLMSELEVRYRTFFAYAGVGILMIDQQGNVIDANPACERLLAYPHGEIREQNYRALVHGRDFKTQKIQAWLDHPGDPACLEAEIRLLSRTSQEIWTRAIHTPVRNTPSSPQYFVIIIEDITQKKLAERRLERLRIKHEATLNRLMLLTKRELEVLWLMVDGDPTKIIAHKLGISQKTIDVHRGRVMEKMQASSLPQLVQAVMPVRKFFTQHD